MAVEDAYSGLRVLELGARLAVGGCGSFLSQTGAEVTFVDLSGHSHTLETKHTHRALFTAGKSAVCVDMSAPSDIANLQRHVDRADVIITSHDVDPDWRELFGDYWANGKIHCDVSAFGQSGPLAGIPYSDFQIQAMTGLIDTTGDATEPASRIAIPVVECLAALNAFAGLGAAIRTRRTQGLAQHVEVALYDCAFAASASFLAKFVADGDIPKRVGNRHPMTLPWNVYRAADEWVLICTSSNDHWQRLAKALGDVHLIDDDELKTAPGRARRADELDAAISAWVSNQTANDCVTLLADLSIPCATIAPFDGRPVEPNLEHRGQICQLRDPLSDRTVFVPGPVIRTLGRAGQPPRFIPGRERLGDVHSTPDNHSAPGQIQQLRTLPLEGIRVIEIGSLTTGPLCGRMMASLGADVIKVEPPSGDAMRQLPPLKNGQGYFFSYYNSDKRSVALDLKAEADRAKLLELLSDADVLIQNLKEGAFARMGFPRGNLAEINPRLVRCDISGFGQDSIYDGRPAVDSIVQAMSGIMTANQVEGIPMKTGISFVDLQVAILACGATLAGLEQRERSGKGVDIDLAMQDIASWSTQTTWNGAPLPPPSLIVACSDGKAIALCRRDELTGAIPDSGLVDSSDAHFAFVGKCADAVQLLECAGYPAAELNTVADALNHPQTVARKLHFELSDPVGGRWPAVRVPIHLSETQPVMRSVIGPIDHDAQSVFESKNRTEEVLAQ